MSVSIILFTERVERLNYCIEHIQLHTPLPYELIIINELEDRAGVNRYQGMPGVRILNWLGQLSPAEGFKIGASLAEGDVLVFIHDYVAVTSHWLNDLAECLDNNPALAAVSPMINDVDGEQRLDYAYPTLDALPTLARGMRAVRSRSIRMVDHLSGPIFAVRKEAYISVGGFDPEPSRPGAEYALFFGRLRLAGHELAIAQDCVVVNTLPREHGQAELTKRERARTVSLCMIVKNEEQTLERCLSSVQDIVDEMIIVDTGSTDLTKAIARKFTDRVYDFEWVNDFAKARNYAFDQATTDYILWLDADDVLLPKDAELLGQTLSELTLDTDAISMPYHLAVDEDGRVLSSLRRNRIVKRSRGFRWIGKVHEYLEVSGNIVPAEAAVTHKREHTQTMRNLLIYEEREKQGEVFSPRDMFYYGNELCDHKLWERAIEQYETFLDQGKGWQEDCIAACGRAADAYQALGRLGAARMKVLQSFTYASPRPQNCCRLGSYHMEEGDYAGAITWYMQALHVPSFVQTAGLSVHGYQSWVPHLQLCVCYDRLNMHEEARMHNEEAAKLMPFHPSVLTNRNYFDSLKQHVAQH